LKRRPHGRIEVTERGHDDDGHVADDRPDVGQRHEAVVGTQPHVEQDRVGVQPRAGVEGRIHVGSHLDDMAIVGEQLAQAPADGVLVIDDQDAAHGEGDRLAVTSGTLGVGCRRFQCGDR